MILFLLTITNKYCSKHNMAVSLTQLLGVLYYLHLSAKNECRQGRPNAEAGPLLHNAHIVMNFKLL